jgi:hypothetical protein
LCKAGNTTGIHPLHVLQKARSEALAEKDNDKDEIQDLLKEAQIEKENGVKFIQKIDLLPFSAILFDNDSLNLLHRANHENAGMCLYLDATGGILRNMNGFSVLNHTLVLPFKSDYKNKNHDVVAVAELITVDNCSFNIEYFLRLVKAKYQALHKGQQIARAIVTDKSYANINAIVSSQNNISFIEYLKLMHRACVDNADIKKILFVFLCSSHLAKNWKTDIIAAFGSRDKERIYLICALVGNLVHFRKYGELTEYIQNLIKFFCCPTKNHHYEATVAKLKSMIVGGNDLIDCAETKGDDENIEDEEKISDDADEMGSIVDKIISNKPIYIQSPFHAQFTKFMDELDFDDDSSSSDESAEENVYYAPVYIKDFLKKWIAIIPLWSGVFVAHSVEADKEFIRPNNGFVEGHFSSIKGFFRTQLGFGKIGSVKLGRYVRYVKERNKIKHKKIELSLPDRHPSRKSAKKESKSAFAEMEQWKGRTKESSTVMFSRRNLAQKFGNLFFNFF